MTEYADNATIIGRQQRITVVLLGLLAHDLPPVSWDIDSVGPNRRTEPTGIELTGQIGVGCGDAAARVEAIAAWADHLRTRPQWTQYHSGGSLHVVAEIVGVRVDVWTSLDACPAEYAPEKAEVGQ